MSETISLGYYFIDSDGTPVNVREIRKVPYTGRIYGVDVPNDIVLVKKKGRTVWSGNSDQKMREFSRHGDIVVGGQVNATCSGSRSNTVDQLTVLSILGGGVCFDSMSPDSNTSVANVINITNEGVL